MASALRWNTTLRLLRFDRSNRFSAEGYEARPLPVDLVRPLGVLALELLKVLICCSPELFISV